MSSLIKNASLALEINNNAVQQVYELYTFGGIRIRYSTQTRQVYLHNDPVNANTYYLQCTFKGNVETAGVINYSFIPAQGRATIVPDMDFYISFGGKGVYDPELSISVSNEKLIWQDLTITDDSGLTLGCNLNNQCIRDDINRILLSCVLTTSPA